MGVVCLPPCINASEADFTVEPLGEGLAVRYALGALKNVGEGAMATMVAERVANGPFATLDEFTSRISARLLNKRQVESLAGAGGFDCLGLERAAVHAAAETLLAVAARAEDERTSGQGGLFGDVGGPADTITLPDVTWSMAERMAAEREAYGFYFSAHPVDRYKHLADAHGARSFAALSAQPAPVDGSRTGATMACLIEDVRWRTSARGRRYAMAKLSDATSQFDASCFDDEVSKAMEEVAASGGCALLTVELDRQPGEETPRVTIKRVQKFEGLANNTRLKAEVEVGDVAGVLALAALVSGERGGRGELLLHTNVNGTRASLRLGRDFALDAELAQRIEALPGVISMQLGPADSHLRLVG